MYSCDSPYNRIKVIDAGMLRVLKFDRCRQSSMYLDDPFETDFEYPGYLHLTMAIKPTATRTLVVGLGGGTVVKRMWRDYHKMHIDVVELDPAVVDVAHRFFELPDHHRINVFVGDGREFLSTTTETYDIIIVDAFDDDRIPRPLLTEEFLREARDHLSSDGALAYNVIGRIEGDHSKPFRSLYRTVGNVWRRRWVFDVSDAVTGLASNIVLLATDAEVSAEELVDRIASRVDGMVSVPAFDRFGEDLYQLPIRTGDVPIITEAHTGKPPRKRRR